MFEILKYSPDDKGIALQSKRTCYRTLIIYNVSFQAKKMANQSTRNTNTRDSVDVSCFNSHKGPNGIHF